MPTVGRNAGPTNSNQETTEERVICPLAQEHEASSGDLDGTRPTTEECADMGLHRPPPRPRKTCLSWLCCSAPTRAW